MFEAFTSKFNPDIFQSMQDLWKNECQKEELKSVEIWKRKQSWLERYEEEYDSRNIFRKEEQFDFHFKISYCIFSANFAVIFMLTKNQFRSKIIW
jgi:hypothetical protein